jgi:hypothetical protein
MVFQDFARLAKCPTSIYLRTTQDFAPRLLRPVRVASHVHAVLAQTRQPHRLFAAPQLALVTRVERTTSELTFVVILLFAILHLKQVH